MLDRKFILENVELVNRNCAHRGVTADVNQFVELETQRKAMQAEVERLNREANLVSKSIGRAKDATEREARKEEGRALREQTAEVRARLEKLTVELDAIHRAIPNVAHPDVPVGVDEGANRELSKGKTPVPAFDFEPLDHVELAERLDLIDFAGGGRVAGHGFYFLKGDMVLLELAVIIILKSCPLVANYILYTIKRVYQD